MIYPKWVYKPREDVTRENMRQYEKMHNDYWNKLYERYPDFSSLPFRRKIEIREEIDNIMGYSLS